MYIEMVSRMMLLVWDVSAGMKRRVARNERGEIGSWMIMAAGLAVAAAAAIVVLKPWFAKKSGEITKN